MPAVKIRCSICKVPVQRHEINWQAFFGEPFCRDRIACKKRKEQKQISDAQERARDSERLKWKK